MGFFLALSLATSVRIYRTFHQQLTKRLFFFWQRCWVLHIWGVKKVGFSELNPTDKIISISGSTEFPHHRPKMCEALEKWKKCTP